MSASTGQNQTPPTHPPLPHTQSTGAEHLARYGNATHIQYHSNVEQEPPRRLRDLFRKPVIRQWIEDGKLIREVHPREVPRMELFFDLLFVGVIHQLAEASIEEPSGDAVARFVLTFWPSWSIWEEARRYSNVSGMDDLLHRVWVLVGMGCILGYSVNASAIELHPHEEELELDHTAVHAAAAFWLVVKLSRVLVLWYYAWRLPKFRIPQFLSGCAVLVPMCVYLPLVWVTNRRAQIILASVGIVVDLIRFDALLLFITGRIANWRLHRQEKQLIAEGRMTPAEAQAVDAGLVKMVLPKGLLIPAINIEHSIERSSAFVTIVLGELVMNLLYTASKGEFGASPEFGKAAMGLMIAWAMNYLYMIPSEELNEYEHALRRSWFTGIMFSFLHWPLCASLLLASAASARLVQESHGEYPDGVRWYWGCGLGFALLLMALIDAMHHNLHPWRASRIPRGVRFAVSFVAALALILYPLAQDLSGSALLGIAVAVTWTVLAVNIVGIMPSKWAHNTADTRGWREAGTDVVAEDMDGGRGGERGIREAIDARMGVIAST